jgi:hypothetical protein
LEFRHLKYIVAVAEQRTFTAAALSVPVAQSALGRQIADTDHVQWTVKERICYALIREHELLRDGLTTRPIQGVSLMVDSAIAYKSDSEQLALPLLLRELEKRFPLANMRPQRKPPASVPREPTGQASLALDDPPGPARRE